MSLTEYGTRLAALHRSTVAALAGEETQALLDEAMVRMVRQAMVSVLMQVRSRRKHELEKPYIYVSCLPKTKSGKELKALRLEKERYNAMKKREREKAKARETKDQAAIADCAEMFSLSSLAVKNDVPAENINQPDVAATAGAACVATAKRFESAPQLLTLDVKATGSGWDTPAKGSAHWSAIDEYTIGASQDEQLAPPIMALPDTALPDATAISEIVLPLCLSSLQAEVTAAAEHAPTETLVAAAGEIVAETLRNATIALAADNTAVTIPSTKAVALLSTETSLTPTSPPPKGDGEEARLKKENAGQQRRIQTLLNVIHSREGEILSHEAITAELLARIRQLERDNAALQEVADLGGLAKFVKQLERWLHGRGADSGQSMPGKVQAAGVNLSQEARDAILSLNAMNNRLKHCMADDRYADSNDMLSERERELMYRLRAIVAAEIPLSL